ncbi:hypothetical protein PG996_013931 [Apiospora saccharicola]|uniref:Heterokaryon incompatibility domain-containing protein n=1 Tax=Apiospora saccharicola TaxID=335842 RepID=A0ABR1TGY9_9PEZI
MEFEYQSLQDDKECIRLLEIFPGTSGESIKCGLTEVRLDDERDFMALSYVWGSKENLATITVNGARFQVRRNCEAAIEHIRDPEVSKIIWIDAICINQNSARENAAQVQRMGRTYKDAAKTIIWLGPQETETESTSFLVWGKSRVTDMLQREWWTRVWIIQELCLSKNPVLLIGRREVDWDDFSKKLAFLSQAWNLVRNIGPDRALGSNILINSRALIAIRIKTRAWEGLGRDKVFSLLNIARDNCGVVPDYEHSSRQDPAKPDMEAEINCRITLCIIRSYRNLSILGHLNHSGQARDKYRLPSWVPHWNRPDKGVLGYPEVFMDGPLKQMVYGSDDRDSVTPYAARRQLTSQELDRLEVPGTGPWAIRLPVLDYDDLVEVVDALPPPIILSLL